MGKLELTDVQKQSLRIIARRGAENAEHVLTKWIDAPVTIEVGEVSLIPFAEVSELVGGDEALIAAVAVRLSGDLGGCFFCVFSEESAISLANTMLAKHGRTADSLGEIEQSVLLETVNIVSSAYLNAFGTSIGFVLLPTIPTLACDMAGSLMEMLFMDYAISGNDVLLIPMDFKHEDSDLDWTFFIQPDPPSLAKLLKKLS